MRTVKVGSVSVLDESGVRGLVRELDYLSKFRIAMV